MPFEKLIRWREIPHPWKKPPNKALSRVVATALKREQTRAWQGGVAAMSSLNLFAIFLYHFTVISLSACKPSTCSFVPHPAFISACMLPVEICARDLVHTQGRYKAAGKRTWLICVSRTPVQEDGKWLVYYYRLPSNGWCRKVCFSARTSHVKVPVWNEGW